MESQDVVVTCAKLADGKVSVRVNGIEVCLLPKREDCSCDNLKSAFQAVVETITPARDEGW